MRILTRYILFDLLKVFLLTLACMTAFVFVMLVSKLAFENGLGLAPTLRTLPYVLPQAMQFAVPGTMLLATVTVYGRIAASNEIVAVKSMGISPMTMIWPTFILATLVSFGAVVLNDVAVSWGRGGVQRVIIESLEEIVYGRLRTTRSYNHNNRWKVAVLRVEGRRLIQPVLTLYNENKEKPMTILADEAMIRTDLENGKILLTCVNAEGNFDWQGEGSVYLPGVHQREFSLADLDGRQISYRRPSEYPLRDIGPARKEQRELINQLQQEMTAQMSYPLMTGRMFELAQDHWQTKSAQVHGAQATLQRLGLEPHRRWSSGFSCLCFVMIGAPMAIRLRHGEIWGSFFACFLPILIVYYPMLAGTLDFAKDGVLPPQAVWLGNIVLALWGVWLVRRVVRF